jgi:hypothetical protein
VSQNEERPEPENPYASPQSPSLVHDGSTSPDTDDGLLSAFVGSKADYYLDKWWRLLQDGSGSAGFNWAAFLLCGFWLSYRKMYKVTILFYGIVLLESVLEEVVFVDILGNAETPPVLEPAIGLAAAIICGAFGNRWYFSHARAAVSELRSLGLRDDALLQTLTVRGGTSILASLGMCVLFLVVTFATFNLLDMLRYGVS